MDCGELVWAECELLLAFDVDMSTVEDEWADGVDANAANDVVILAKIYFQFKSFFSCFMSIFNDSFIIFIFKFNCWFKQKSLKK